MANNLLTPILNASTVSVNFFNGRLFSAEDINVEKKANSIAHSLLGQAIGSGIAYGLEVDISAASNTVATPVLSVKQGLAINRSGTALLLEKDTEISLIRPAITPVTNGSTAKSFQVCTPVQSGTYVAGAGVYLLLVCPASGSQGLAEVVGISTAAAACNTKYQVDGVQFRLVQLNLNQTELGGINHLRNLVAYKCFGVADWSQEVTDPFGAPPQTFGLIDQLRAAKQVTDCEVPLALMYWTATSGLVWVDMWAVRRRVTHVRSAGKPPSFVGDQVLSESEASFFQFQAQIGDLIQESASPQLLNASDTFSWLPPVGIIPALTQSSAGIDYSRFFLSTTYRNPVYINGARLEMVLRASLRFKPIDLGSDELIWLYLVRENRQQPQAALATPYLVFVTGHAPFFGDPHYNVARWDFANYF